MISRPDLKSFSKLPRAYLIILEDITGYVEVVTLTGEAVLGRKGGDNTPEISLSSPIVSRCHGRFTVSSGSFYYTDADSLNGTFVNGRHITGKDGAVRLGDGDVLRIDTPLPGRLHKNAVTIVFSLTYDRRCKWHRLPLTHAGLSVGRDVHNSLEFDSSKTRVKMANLSVNSSQTILRPERGMKPYLNGNLVSDALIVNNKDVIRFANDFIFFSQNEICYNTCSADECGLVVRINETVVNEGFSHKTLLKDISLEVDKGDFALIIGGSGAGKSTLVNSILGKYTINGSIVLGGKAVTPGSAEAARIAYVPQTLAIRKEERLIDVVRDTALLRMNGDMSPSEREAFIWETLDRLGLKGKAKSEIKKLSGGEQRRAAIANEVVTNSDVFFLDEPDSGLDPKSGISLMQNLKSLSDKGKMVMLISHNYASYPNPEQIYSKVIILAKSNEDGIGRLAFSGSVREALSFFGVDELKDITKLINPLSENGDGRADEFVEKYRRLY